MCCFHWRVISIVSGIILIKWYSNPQHPRRLSAKQEEQRKVYDQRRRVEARLGKSDKGHEIVTHNSIIEFDRIIFFPVSYTITIEGSVGSISLLSWKVASRIVREEGSLPCPDRINFVSTWKMRRDLRPVTAVYSVDKLVCSPEFAVGVQGLHWYCGPTNYEVRYKANSVVVVAVVLLESKASHNLGLAPAV